MNDLLSSLIQRATSPALARNIAREYLQARILEQMQLAGVMGPLAFQGGTALRFLYAIPRYSEDLDFALEKSELTYDFGATFQTVKEQLEKEGYRIDVKTNTKKVVNSAFVRFQGLLHQLGISTHRNEVLAIKVEVDTGPPAGATTAITVVRRYIPLQLQHHDPASLLAGKLHAILQRPYVKGRDIYDLFWYLSDPTWPAPNLLLLQNALAQTNYAGPELTATTWRPLVAERIKTLEWSTVAEDVRPFVERESDLQLLTHENVLSLV